ncbi:MAG: hypothetical protein KBG48_28375 [Kofleriaceae bacterium]|jgi:hypothetical protein|nr:hypothetical protein [Kofleriaceae bacterium]MBP9171347.1 hypothetical protein [Kofleriaceae bacterium]MBP9860806.1 hypothetical protein [Kofleriaceae bacterium]
MKRSWIAGFGGGIAVAVAFMIACSDDSPSDADAAVCDCPAAEPPLAGRIVSVQNQTSINPGTGGGGTAVCPTGATLLGGGCGLMTPDDRVRLTVATPSRSGEFIGYQCRWSGQDVLTANTGTMEAICLVPAQ